MTMIQFFGLLRDVLMRLRDKTNYVVELKSATKFLNIYVDQFMKDELLFIPFMIFKKCNIPFMSNDSDLYVFFFWENGVLQSLPVNLCNLDRLDRLWVIM
jgi:hypothetical protein